jgi:hypothetical protein
MAHQWWGSVWLPVKLLTRRRSKTGWDKDFFFFVTQDGARMGAVRNARGFGAAAHRWQCDNPRGGAESAMDALVPYHTVLHNRLSWNCVSTHSPSVIRYRYIWWTTCYIKVIGEEWQQAYSIYTCRFLSLYTFFCGIMLVHCKGTINKNDICIHNLCENSATEIVIKFPRNRLKGKGE